MNDQGASGSRAGAGGTVTSLSELLSVSRKGKFPVRSAAEEKKSKEELAASKARQAPSTARSAEERREAQMKYLEEEKCALEASLRLIREADARVSTAKAKHEDNSPAVDEDWEDLWGPPPRYEE